SPCASAAARGPRACLSCVISGRPTTYSAALRARLGQGVPMNDLVIVTRDGDVGVLTVNNPPVNALSPGVPEGIVASVEAFEKDAAVRAIVLIGGGRTFIAGADIKEFGKITSGQKRHDSGLPTLVRTLEDFPKPVVAAIHGTAFG